jgi:hypothetical protein
MPRNPLRMLDVAVFTDHIMSYLDNGTNVLLLTEMETISKYFQLEKCFCREHGERLDQEITTWVDSIQGNHEGIGIQHDIDQSTRVQNQAPYCGVCKDCTVIAWYLQNARNAVDFYQDDKNRLILRVSDALHQANLSANTKYSIFAQLNYLLQASRDDFGSLNSVVLGTVRRQLAKWDLESNGNSQQSDRDIVILFSHRMLEPEYFQRASHSHATYSTTTK